MKKFSNQKPCLYNYILNIAGNNIESANKITADIVFPINIAITDFL